jgi:hypothetical protein
MDDKQQRLAKALRENLKRRKAFLPGTGRGTAARSDVVEGAPGHVKSPLHQPPANPPPRPGED